MAKDQPQNLPKQLEAERQRVRELEKEREELVLKLQTLENKWANYKPLADAWLREHMPSKEVLEKEFAEMLAHPETWVDFKDVLVELEAKYGADDS
jgi:hypothetical protein